MPFGQMLARGAATGSAPGRRYTLPHLLCVDEVGYLSYDSRYADLLLEVVTRRYDAHRPLLLSANKALSEWGEVFPHAAWVVTLVDRLIHRAEVIEIDAERPCGRGRVVSWKLKPGRRQGWASGSGG
jgi:DNA replication protein DnaC